MAEQNFAKNLESLTAEELADEIRQLHTKFLSYRVLTPIEEISELFSYLVKIALTDHPQYSQVISSLRSDGTLQGIIRI